ncbi:hypothetical protein PV08_11277 [Exophiala spinifera]|uniref:Xylanolytic transcriptional activator regulatory domain-containing protein n=1 Tax=Exophiala spinifera TaxID=91928 RepID=A0A0D2AUY6_9EURO|nr:uncharacterized protein PV08_11277 [Exophiala spinifera]KIW10315.1 hypothetical protein PV08_11277 [Exophiala spinifera]
MAESEPRSIKPKRALKACDFCHRRGRGCRIDPADNSRCLTCLDFGVSCTWNRPSAKRGKPRGSKGSGVPWTLSPDKHGSRELIQDLLINFFESVYPVLVLPDRRVSTMIDVPRVCTVHEQSFMHHWHTKQIPSGRASYARLMSVCALSACRIASGATFTPREISCAVTPNVYLDEAIAAIPGTFGESLEFEYLQAINLVCLTARECGNAALLQQYLGLYHGALAEQGYYDERRWPSGISTIEREERRRLYWHMYRLEIHTSLVLGHAVRCPELQSAVAYPTLPDQDFTESMENLEWLTGWNFITDIYRGIEHLISYFRNKRTTIHLDNRCLSTAFLIDYDPQEKIVRPLNLAYSNLPLRFKKAQRVSQDIRLNRCGFQTANIIATYQLLRMLSFTSNDTTFHEACRTALELIEEISSIPMEYMRAMGLAMIQELSGLGHILSSFIKKELPRSDYQHLRMVMVCMAELLENLATSIPAAAWVCNRLREYVEQIDRYFELRPLQEDAADHELGRVDEVAVQDFDPEIFIPLELLQRIPWDWTEQRQMT